ncbi:MAG: type IV toxin-antitoxin system AbiEi family antitoxin domain-containing protein [Planctomycetaceae bacterium]|nr:type IV toxin-antitoxin system AbiEi family antitoxin domain-containing protein [Planctomycetaceae bacterium]
MRPTPRQIDKAKEIFRHHGGMLRTAEVIREGIQPRVLYAMRDAGEVTMLRRGCYRLAELDQMAEPDLAVVAKAAPKGVICLVSALSFHDITTQIPRAVDLALPAHTHSPKIEYPPIQPYWFSGQAYSAGVETHDIDGVRVRIYSPAKTVADCFKYRKKIGKDVAMEALRFCRDRKGTSVAEFLEFARICRVQNIMSPYLEAML